MKKLLIIILLVAGSMLPHECQAQIPIVSIITTALKKVIVAIDLQIQQLQNKTIWLQDAQKTLENTLSELKLQEIGDWVEKQRKLYADYFEELDKVKTVIADYHRIKEITSMEASMLSQYKSAYALFQQDSHFTASELDYMYRVYSGILDESLRNIDQLSAVINSFATQMTDEARVKIIDQVARNVEANYLDLQQFNNQNKMISLERSKSEQEISAVKKLYDLP
jgi:hypothetical protein